MISKKEKFKFWNENCIEGCRKHIDDASIDLIITDPPYGIQGASLDKHYNRKEDNVVGGYIDVPIENYSAFSLDWITESARITRGNGTIFIISGWSNLNCILSAIEIINKDAVKAGKKPTLHTVNHIIWKYNFGVFTSRKFVSSHYHILMLRRIPRKGERHKITFNYNSEERFDVINQNQRVLGEKEKKRTKIFYEDMQDVWAIKRQYRPGEIRNKNQLPDALVDKMIQYSSLPGDLVCDLFLGGFTTAKRCQKLNRRCCGFELNSIAFEEFNKEFI